MLLFGSDSFLVKQEICFLIKCHSFWGLWNTGIITLIPLILLCFTVAVVVSAICRVAAVNHYTIQVVNLIRDWLKVFLIAVHCGVHMLFHIKTDGIPHFLHDFFAENIKSLDSNYQNSWWLVYCKAFCRVLLCLTNRAQIFVIFR